MNHVDLQVVREEDLPQTVSEESVVEHDGTIPSPEEGVAQGFDPRVARAEDGKDPRLRRGPGVAEQAEHLAVVLDPRLSVVRHRGLRQFPLDTRVEWNRSWDEKKGWAHGTWRKDGCSATSKCLAPC